MSPRPYRLGQRQGPVDQSRRQILEAARQLLGGTDRYTAFTVDAVARQADVARATVYYQFGSKAGLLEALCDHLAELGGLAALPAAFAEADPAAGLRALITAFGEFWAADRPAMRRLRALARLDPEVGAVIAARDQRRRDALTVLAGRLEVLTQSGLGSGPGPGSGSGPGPGSGPGSGAMGLSRGAERAGGLVSRDAARVTRLLTVLTSFETFDALAGADQEITVALPEIIRLAEAAIRLPD